MGFALTLFVISQNIYALEQNSKNKIVDSIVKTSRPLFEKELIFSEYGSWAITEEYQVSSIRLREAWEKLGSNTEKTIRKSVLVAVIDTGIDYNHSFIKNNIEIPRGLASSGNYGMDFSKGTKDKNKPEDMHGHGTHIAGVIKSVIPDVKILPLKYYNPTASDSDNLKSTVLAIEFAIEQNVDIINYSSGGPGASLEELRALKKAEEKGILIVAAAGNRSSNIDDIKNAYYPASYGLSNIITVINHDSDGRLGPSSNFGKTKADISAPGTRIRSTLPGGRAGYLTGTSQATAFVTGVAALLKSQYSTLDYKQLKKLIIDSARSSGELKEKCVAGGMLDASRAVDEAQRLLEMKKLERQIAQSF